MQPIFRLLLRNSRYQLSREEMIACFGAGCCSLCFLLIHLFFILYHCLTRTPVMALVNIGSVAIYTAALLANLPTRGKLPTLLIPLEIELYCLTASYFLGIRAGTYTFLPLMMVLYLIIFNLPNRQKIVYAGTLLATTALCFYIGWSTQPYYTHFDIPMMLMVNAAACTFGSLLLVAVLKTTNSISEESYESQIQMLSSKANMDSLTQMWNRRYAEDFLGKLYDEKRQLSTVFIAMVDIDFFKGVNDTYGHDIGDEVLKYIGSSIKGGFRASDVGARWGGEEFLLILRGLDEASARTILENFRQKIAMSLIPTNHGALRVTVTIGYSVARLGESYAQCIKRSDEALYYGKNSGRNRVINHADIPLPQEETPD